eukprot:scaffold46028_cov55-Phaeocystis_antarctica.AAC.4
MKGGTTRSGNRSATNPKPVSGRSASSDESSTERGSEASCRPFLTAAVAIDRAAVLDDPGVTACRRHGLPPSGPSASCPRATGSSLGSYDGTT